MKIPIGIYKIVDWIILPFLCNIKFKLVFLAPNQGTDDLESAEPATAVKWTPICINPIAPGTLTPAKMS